MKLVSVVPIIEKSRYHITVEEDARRYTFEFTLTATGDEGDIIIVINADRLYRAMFPTRTDEYVAICRIIHDIMNNIEVTLPVDVSSSSN
jgi:hypothetical protein